MNTLGNKDIPKQNPTVDEEVLNFVKKSYFH